MAALLRGLQAVAGARAPAYRLTKADATATSYGQKALVTVLVAGTNALGSARVYADPGIVVDGPRAKPTSITAALDSAGRVWAGDHDPPADREPRPPDIGALSRRAGRVDLYWALNDTEGARKVAELASQDPSHGLGPGQAPADAVRPAAAAARGRPSERLHFRAFHARERVGKVAGPPTG